MGRPGSTQMSFVVERSTRSSSESAYRSFRGPRWSHLFSTPSTVCSVGPEHPPPDPTFFLTALLGAGPEQDAAWERTRGPSPSTIRPQ